ncbi:MAG TPA: inositol monophosphatase family protein [bacterium]|nr:inositol monophosphatase family protein [bacterium]
MPALSSFTLSALRAARAAGEIQRRLLGRLTRVEYKGWHDPVTEADRSSEDAIVAILREAFPDHAFLGEEGGQRGSGAYMWLIDPLDGTHNYARGFPWFGISIALRHSGRILASVIHNPLLDEVYAAESGTGAYAATLRDLSPDPARWADLSLWRRISVSTTQVLREATLATGFPPTVAETRVNLDHFTNLLLAAARVRTIGSAALSLAAVALGQMDGYWEIGPNAWDFAGGALLVEEAGGRVSDLRGRPLESYGGQLLATNGRIHDEVTAVLARGRSGEP